MFFLKQSTAVDIKLGPFVDKTDGVTYETGMAAAMDNATTGVRLSKNGAAFGDRAEATEPAYDAFGYYLVKLDTTDTNTVGQLKVIFGDAAVCLPCEANFQVLEEAVYDALVAASAAGYGTAQTGDSYAIINGASGCVAIKGDTAAILLDTGTDGVVLPQAQADKVWSTAARVLTANTNLNDPTATAIADAVWDEAATGHTDAGKAGAQLWTDIDAIAVDVAGLDGAAMRGTDSAALASVCTEGRLAELDAANLIADVAAVKVDTAAILADTGTDGVVVAAASKSGYALSAAGVDAILDDAPAAELSAIPSTTGTLRQMVQFLFSYFRNKKTVTATTETLMKEDASTSLGTSTVSDDGTTFTKGEMG